jgi:hypothetical protein
MNTAFVNKQEAIATYFLLSKSHLLLKHSSPGVNCDAALAHFQVNGALFLRQRSPLDAG